MRPYEPRPRVATGVARKRTLIAKSLALAALKNCSGSYKQNCAKRNLSDFIMCIDISLVGAQLVIYSPKKS
jgi:hypothetical protein